VGKCELKQKINQNRGGNNAGLQRRAWSFLKARGEIYCGTREEMSGVSRLRKGKKGRFDADLEKSEGRKRGKEGTRFNTV